MTSAEGLLINKVLNDALERKATDIHLTVGNYPVMRVAGRLVVMTQEQVLTPDFINRIIESFVSEKDRERLDKNRELTSVYTWADRARFRASVFYQKGFPSVSLRLIPQRLPLPKEIGISSTLIETTTKQRGLVLVTGPFNSGRTTTVFSLLEYINQNEGKHILTLEKPIEYLMINNQSVFTQREVGKDTPTFVAGLDMAEDEDVDVIAIGDMEEKDQVTPILEAVESGKLVYVIMNAQTTISALESFQAGLPEERRTWGREVMSEALLVVTTQRLVPGVKGGMALAFEILTVTDSVKNSVKDGNFSQLHNVILTSRQSGMISLDRNLAELVQTGVISSKDALAVAQDPGTVQQISGK